MVSSGSPFLTALDHRAEVKGSVDPLGAMAIWSRLGRRVVGNLTTVTGSLKDFKTLVIGFALLDDVRRRLASPGDAEDLQVFLRWEQLAAYTRAHINGDYNFRGVRRVRERLSEDLAVALSAERDCQILGNQKVYGLWGLYSVAARASGLVDRDRNELTPEAARFVDRTWRRPLAPVWSFVVNTISEDRRRFRLDREEPKLRKLKSIWTTTDPAEAAFWRDHLVYGGPDERTGGLQRRLAALLAASGPKPDSVLNNSEVHRLAEGAAKQTPRLADYLRDIAACESVLAPTSALFGYLQTLDRQPLERALKALAERWPGGVLRPDERFADLRLEVVTASGSEQVGELWARIHTAMRAGSWRELLDAVLALNAVVMQSRGGAPWVALENGVFRVRLRDEAASLPPAVELSKLWRNTYFLDSLKAVTMEVGA